MHPFPVQESFTMRTTRILLAALSLALVAACTAEPVGVVPSDEKPAMGVGFVGTGNSAGADSTTIAPVERGVGVSGSGN
jgi:hypothetical protein